MYSDGKDSMMVNMQLWQIFSCGRLDIFSYGKYLWKDTYVYTMMAKIQ